MPSDNKPTLLSFGRGRTVPLDEIRQIIAASPDTGTAVATIVARYRVCTADAHELIEGSLWTVFHKDSAS